MRENEQAERHAIGEANHLDFTGICGALFLTLAHQLRGEGAGVILMAEKARISGDFWFVTFDAHRLRHRFKVTLKSVRVAIRLRTCVAGKIFCVVGFWIQCVTGLAPFVTHEAEVGRVLEDSE